MIDFIFVAHKVFRIDKVSYYLRFGKKKVPLSDSLHQQTMKRTILLMAALLAAAGAAAQEAGRIYRTEVIPYDTRRDAEARDRTKSGYTIDFRPGMISAAGADLVVGQEVEIPYVWTDGVVYLHLENVRSAYTLRVNGREVARVEDPATPTEFELTGCIRQGKNDIRLELRDSGAERINAAPGTREAFSGSYLYYQNKRSIRDFEIALVADTAGRRFGMLDLKIIAQNAFNYDEAVTVGFDIYSPQGKLLEFNMKEVTIPGRSTDTVRFSPYIYGTYDNIWSADRRNPPLYRVMLFTRRDGAYKEYMPLRLGFGRAELVDGRLMRLGRELQLATASCNAAADPATTRRELLALKVAGKNTVCPDCPQPAWFYELCDEVGLYVIDRANINAPDGRENRAVGGTPSNDPALADEYLERVKAMYYRSRNFTCVIAYALGGPSGNGYNMYKAYQWLKSVEKSRPVIYADADGEWNSDL